jgi:hypothetical protein
MVAGGTGIAPLFQMASEMLQDIETAQCSALQDVTAAGTTTVQRMCLTLVTANRTVSTHPRNAGSTHFCSVSYLYRCARLHVACLVMYFLRLPPRRVCDHMLKP